MDINENQVKEYIEYFFSRIVGFKNQDIKYIPMSPTDNEFLSIAMDKVDRLTRKGGRLRNRVWSNCYFIFHDEKEDPAKAYSEKVTEIKQVHPYLFIRSYVYFVYINVAGKNQSSLLEDGFNEIKTNDYKIWLFNSKYELKEETRRTNLFGITLSDNEIVDDYIYLANPESEISRIESSNADAVDCVRAFTSDLELLEQTSNMLELVRTELSENNEARILVEGPARSGKTVIAASLLGEYEDSKFLLMNYFFYQAIVDGFHALSGWSREEIESLVMNTELDSLLELDNKVPSLLKSINKNLGYAANECDVPKRNSNTKTWLMENIDSLNKVLKELAVPEESLSVVVLLNEMSSKIAKADDLHPFQNINKVDLASIRKQINNLVLGKYDDLSILQNQLYKAIEELIKNSKQKFFHHNINTKISSDVTKGCWIKRGNPTRTKMWTHDYKPQLVICDEVQRLGHINSYRDYDEFNEIEQILSNSKRSFFVGDNFQMLNSKYDQGVEEINCHIGSKGQHLTRLMLPESVGVPAEVGVLMKLLTNPQSISIDEVVNYWLNERYFELMFVYRNTEKLINLFDDDNSSKKHFAAPMDALWLSYDDKISIDTKHRSQPITSLKDHEKTDFRYKFPYFCNEEIMPNYILSAYELISREVESLYIHVPDFSIEHEDRIWFQKHLYVLFTRPTGKLVVNFDDLKEYDRIKSTVNRIWEKGGRLAVEFG